MMSRMDRSTAGLAWGARMRRIVLIVVALLLLLVIAFGVRNRAVLRNLPNPWTSLTVMPLRGGAYWVKGGVSNTGFIVGDKGVIVIDTQMFEATARTAMAEIARITPKPVRDVILTHVDPDHINGLPAYPRGVNVILHENTRRRIVERLKGAGWKMTTPPAALRAYLPASGVERDADIVLEGVPLRLIHVGPAHTDGDLVIYLPRQKIVYAGDVLTPSVGPYPGIHMDEGGASLGWIRFVEALLKLDADIYVADMERVEVLEGPRAETHGRGGDVSELHRRCLWGAHGKVRGPTSSVPVFVEEVS